MKATVHNKKALLKSLGSYVSSVTGCKDANYSCVRNDGSVVVKLKVTEHSARENANYLEEYLQMDEVSFERVDEVRVKVDLQSFPEKHRWNSVG